MVSNNGVKRMNGGKFQFEKCQSRCQSIVKNILKYDTHTSLVHDMYEYRRPLGYGKQRVLY